MSIPSDDPQGSTPERESKTGKLAEIEQKKREIREIKRGFRRKERELLQRLDDEREVQIAKVEADIALIEDGIVADCANHLCRNIYSVQPKTDCTVCRESFCNECISHPMMSSVHPPGTGSGWDGAILFFLALIEALLCILPSELFHRRRCKTCIAKAWW
jgi:hypothetical protein